MTKAQEEISELVRDQYARCPPSTQEECCALAARVSVAINGAPTHYGEAGRALAAGLFGPAYQNAGWAQQLVWKDMCERALLDAAFETARPR